MKPYNCPECHQPIFNELSSHLTNCGYYQGPCDLNESCEDLYGMTDAEFKDMVLPDEGDHR